MFRTGQSRFYSSVCLHAGFTADSAAAPIGLSGASVLMEWQQPTSSIYFSGAHRFIRLYDANKELQVQDILTGSESAVTSLCTDPIARHKVIASCNDGSVRVFDRRLPSPERYV